MRNAIAGLLCISALWAGPGVADESGLRLSSMTRGLPADAGGTVEYSINVSNAGASTVSATLAVERIQWAAMPAEIAPAAVELSPGAVTQVSVRVTVPERVPPGGHEPQIVKTSTGQSLKLVTARRLEHPNILFTKAGWDEIRAKCEEADWAKKQKAETVDRAEKWGVPNVQKPNNPQPGDWLFVTSVENGLMDAAIAYQLTGDAKFAEKVRGFLMNLSNPTNGFPVTRRGCHQGSVQEGHFFQHIVQAYDMALPSGVFTDSDRAQIDATFRLFIGEERDLGSNNISNWCVSWDGGALMCALVLQDLGAADWVLNVPGGVYDQFRRGTLDDGWWYECSISYNTWCSTMFTKFALALEPWGYNLLEQHFPSNYRPSDDEVTPPEKEEYGMSKARWGPIHQNYITIKRMWDALPPMLDYRGMMFGLNDSNMKPVGGAAMDIAYYAFHDPAYAAVIRRGDSRDLLYGAADLPTNGPDRTAESVYADNAGVAVLRSQTAGRPQSERIQAVLHYGDHGWYHGHFDRTELLHLSRYGRSFFNPEMIWYSYGPYMYKFYVQTSVSKNMVVVDRKMQEPVASQRLLFHSGPMMQAAVVQTRARWSNPPYGGMNHDADPVTNFADRALAEGRSIPIPSNPPPHAKFGSVTDYTEPILQRRALVVADDYIVIADYLKAEQEHTFEALWQMKGFQGLKNAKPVRHTAQWDPNPIRGAQFVTDCDWFDGTAPSIGSYEFRFGPDADNRGSLPDPGTDGVLKFDVHTVWPPRHEIMVGTPPENHGAQRVKYTIKGDGKVLLEGETGAWILGAVDVDVPVAGVKTLQLSTDQKDNSSLFWVGANVSANVVTNDAQGGPIKIQGEPYAEAMPAVTTIDLSGRDATRFTARFGRDFPPGNESQRRKTVAVGVTGTEARFLTVIEPYEDKPAVKSATATGPDSLRVELLNGRVQEIAIKNLEGSGEDVTAEMVETAVNGETRRESARD